jgi:hypothetical protein
MMKQDILYWWKILQRRDPHVEVLSPALYLRKMPTGDTILMA